MPFLKPMGIGDLIVMKKRLLEYLPGEIAHIENVMAKEERNRFHRRLHRLEMTAEVESEKEEERKRDLQTTERFELENEIKNEVKTQHKLAVGVEVSGGFGPVQLSAYAKYDFTEAREDSQRTSQKYAREVTEKAMERIRERTRELRRTVELQETEERNEHKFKNDETTSIAGIYRWVDKKYLVKPLNYGKRLFYEIVIPEPATAYIYNRVWNIQNSALPEKPPEPTVLKPGPTFPFWFFAQSPLTPSDLNRDNYASFVATYGVEGVKPPPPERVIVSRSIGKELDGQGDFILEGEDIRLPDGYEATMAVFQLLLKSWASHENVPGATVLRMYTGNPTIPYAKIQIGQKATVSWRGIFDFEFAGEEPRVLELNRETQLLPMSGAGNYVGALAMNIEIECERSAQLYQQWQLATFQAIWTAYQRQLGAYEEKLAAARISGGVQISGDNPERNLVAIKDELRRSFLQLWMRDEFSVLTGWRAGNPAATPPTLPQLLPDGAEANADKLYFVEEAFDWDNLSFKLMPYFTGSQSKWLELSGYRDPDPVFENFLKAGAALVRIPVQPKFTHAVLYYQLTGLRWPRYAGDVPALSTLAGPDAALYNQYLGEVDPDEDNSDIFNTDTISEDDPDVFEIKVPTQLVWLQPDSALSPTSPPSPTR